MTEKRIFGLFTKPSNLLQKVYLAPGKFPFRKGFLPEGIRVSFAPVLNDRPGNLKIVMQPSSWLYVGPKRMNEHAWPGFCKFAERF